MSRAYSCLTVVTLSAAAMFASCGDDLGTCDRVAAEELVYSDNGMVATKGQALVHDSCGQGTSCHSAAAQGGDRVGAPADMSFDMLPRPTGWPDIIEHRADVWEQVESGHMAKLDAAGIFAPGGWVFDLRRAASAPELPGLASAEGKAALRNWLACGAPLVSETELPSWLDTTHCASSGDEAFDALYKQVLRPRCATACHNLSAPGGLNMANVCDAYEGLQQSGACGVRLRVGDVSSPLLDQIASRTPSCGLPMPPDEPLASEEITAVRDYIQASDWPEQE